jgi:hypothetical protein
MQEFDVRVIGLEAAYREFAFDGALDRIFQLRRHSGGRWSVNS